MAYKENFPADDDYIGAFPEGAREQFRALKDDKIVNAGKINDLVPGNAEGQISINNGTENDNLNAALLNGHNSGFFATADHVHDVATGSSDGFMSNSDKNKLDGIESGAEVNQNAFANITVGDVTLQADAKQDTVSIVAGNNIEIVADESNDSITFNINSVDNAVEANHAQSSDTATNADNATKALQDTLGQEISQTYVKDIAFTNDSVSVTKGNDKTNNFTIESVSSAVKATQDNLGQNITDYVKDIVLEDTTMTITKGDTKTTSTIEIPKMSTKDIVDIIYPVGSIISTLDSTNPGDRWQGTTWEQIEAGRVLVSAGTAETGTVFTAGETGGEETHQLTVGELPIHSHVATTSIDGEHTHGVGYKGYFSSGSLYEPRVPANSNAISSTIAGNHSHAITIADTGGDEAHNNLQPYAVAYIWKRIS